jgi:uncharacterized membrane protein
MNPKPFFIALLVLGFIGFLDATYLTATHFMDSPPGCGEGGGCEEVTTSEYSTLFGLPIAMFGLLFYLSVIFLSLLWFDRGFGFIPRILPFITAPAFLFSGWLVYLMLFVLEAICWYCMGSAASSTLIFLTSVALFLKVKSS